MVHRVLMVSFAKHIVARAAVSGTAHSESRFPRHGAELGKPNKVMEDPQFQSFDDPALKAAPRRALDQARARGT